MNSRLPMVLGLILGLVLAPGAHTASPPIAQTEINYLLDFIEKSDCKFYRNGSWYDAKSAQAHLRSKYELLTANNRINTAESFIEQAATKSSISGRPYQVRCGRTEAVPTTQWLRDALTRYRTERAPL